MNKIKIKELKEIILKNLENKSIEIKRIFHGRGNFYDNFNYLTVDSLNEILLATFFEEIDNEVEKEIIKILEEIILEKEFKTKTHLGEKSETTQDVAFLQKYLTKHLRITIDGKEKEILFLSKEEDTNVMIIYLKIVDVKKLNSIKIHNSALLDLYADQQNIMQTNFYSNKKNYIFTREYFVEKIKIK